MWTEYDKNLKIAEELMIYHNNFDGGRGFCIETNLTDNCNFKCDYCFESLECRKQKNLLDYDKVVRTIDNTINDPWFKRNYDYIQLAMWGGEPLLNMDAVKKLFEAFKKNDRVSFMVYTNGSKIERLIPILLEARLYDVPHLRKKFRVQVSYDGMPIHDIKRKNSKGEPTSPIVLKAMDRLYEVGIPFSLKSTITEDTFKYMSEVWDDIYQLRQKYGEFINYVPTIDYHSDFGESKVDELENAMLDIVVKEYKNIKAGNKPIIGFTKKNSKKCGVGRHMIFINTDGGVYVCHGAPYFDEKDDYRSGNLEENLVPYIKENIEIYKKHYQPDVCIDCIATLCPKCPLAKRKNSKKEDFIDAISDSTCQERLCEYYKTIGQVIMGLKVVIEGD